VASAEPGTDDVQSVREAVGAGADGFLRELVDWLQIPSISGDPAHRDDVRRSADHLADALRRTGFPTVEVWPTGDGAGLPAVFAEWLSDDPGAPTVVVYGHHDVQPAALADGWHSPPFTPTVRGTRLYARGAADDKGQVLSHLLGVRAHLAAQGASAPAVHLKVLVEGEEEVGSVHLGALLRERRPRADVVVVSDTSMWSAEVPSVCTGMRGLTECQVDLFGPEVDVHSGSFGGGVPNPLTALCRLLGRLHDGHGRVTVDGFYDDVVELTPAERAAFARLPFDEAAWLRHARSAALAGEAGYTTLERVWARPTAEVNGLWGGYTGPGGKTIIPASAHAKLSFRLVPNQDPGRIQERVTHWLLTRLPDGIRGEVRFTGPGVRPCRTPLDHPAQQALLRAMGRAFGTDIALTREGAAAGQHLEQHAAERPDVGAPVDDFPFRLLGRHVRGGTQNHAAQRHRR